MIIIDVHNLIQCGIMEISLGQCQQNYLHYNGTILAVCMTVVESIFDHNFIRMPWDSLILFPQHCTGTSWLSIKTEGKPLWCGGPQSRWCWWVCGDDGSSSTLQRRQAWYEKWKAFKLTPSETFSKASRPSSTNKT